MVPELTSPFVTSSRLGNLPAKDEALLTPYFGYHHEPRRLSHQKPTTHRVGHQYGASSINSRPQRHFSYPSVNFTVSSALASPRHRAQAGDTGCDKSLLGSKSEPLHSGTPPHDDATTSDSALPKLHLSPPPLNFNAALHSERFPYCHKLNPYFVRKYQLEYELGSGGYGFVMTARDRLDGGEVAVKFIIKEKVPELGWMEDDSIGRLPTEVMLLSLIDHPGIVKCLDLFEDKLYFYLVQELHGSPWCRGSPKHSGSPLTSSSASGPLSTPSLSPSVSDISLGSEPGTPPSSPVDGLPLSRSPSRGLHIPTLCPKFNTTMRPIFLRRPSHDLFECIEQSEHKRLSEDQARYVFSQVVEAVHYLDSIGITHRDIKDENLVIDKNLKVKLIDFGSATIVDPNKPQPYHTLFFGTSAYASSEILRKQPYQAPPAEIWTLGVLLSFLLTGTSPFPSSKDAVAGNIVLAAGTPGARLSGAVLELMEMCLDPNPKARATIAQVRAHRWLQSGSSHL